MRTPVQALAVVAAVLAAAVIAGCGGSSSGSASSGGGQVQIGSMIWDTSVPFYSNLIKGQKETAAKLGAKIDIANGNGDLPTEIAAIQRFITQKKDVILVTASDPKGIVPAVRQANAAGIPVIAVNNRVDTSSAGAKVVTFVGADDKTFGERQGQMLVKAVGSSAKVGYVQGKLGTSAQLDRREGFLSVLKRYPGIKVVSQQSGDWDNGKALAVIQDMLSKYPKGSLDAIVDQGPEGLNGASWASKQGRTDVRFLLGDYPADVRKGIQSGLVYGSIDQDPRPQGVKSVQYAVDWVKGRKSSVPRPEAYQPLPIVTKANVQRYPAAWGG